MVDFQLPLPGLGRNFNTLTEEEKDARSGVSPRKRTKLTQGVIVIGKTITLRIEYERAIYHVTARVNARRSSYE